MAGLTVPLALMAVAPVQAQTSQASTLPAAAAAASSPAAIPAERFFQYPSILEAKLSPSGKKLALTTSKGGTRIGLVVLDLADGYKAMRTGGFTDADIIEFDWVGDDRLVFSVLDLAAGGGEDRRLAPGLFSAKPDGSELRFLVQRHGKSFVSNGGSFDRTLEWNHRLMKVPMPQAGVLPDEVVIGRMEFGSKSLESITPLWLNVRTGRTRSMEIRGAPAHAVDWLFDSKGEPRVAMTHHDGLAGAHWRGPGETAWRQLNKGDVLKMPFMPKSVDDAGNLFVTFSDGPQGYGVLSRFDFDKMQPQKPALVSAPGFDFNGGLLLDRAGTRALGVRIDTDGEQTVWFDEGMKRTQAMLDERLPGRINQLSCRRCGAEDMVVLVRSYADTDPGHFFLYEAASKRLQPISSVMEGIDPRQMAQVDLQRIKARDGRDLPVWLTQPRGLKAGQPVPAVVLVHGGPWVRIGHWKWQPMEQFLASRGYLVISPEFRGSTGYGDEHYKAGWKQWGQSMQDDVADALLWAQKEGLASSQACIAGASYGGYSTLMGLIKHPELYRCGVAWVAVTDPFLLLKGSWWVEDDLSDSGRSHMLPQMVGDVEKDAAMLTANSPLAQAKQIKAPLLLAFGESDLRVPIAHGERLRAALRDAGRPPEWVSYANEAHGWRMQSTQVDFAKRVEKFLGQHLKAQP
ncbi:prolyl oligopeptidase family serine peptidase [Paucibacter sp. AS339]|uniref:S9 family peptidase n=1 Tax=Paucibacter hankyongi TaxID=3133434 RepID=UPI00309C0A9B